MEERYQMGEIMKFPVRTAPYEAEIAGQLIRFQAVLPGDEYLDVWARMQSKLTEKTELTDDLEGEERVQVLRERAKQSTDAVREFICGLMIEEDVPKFRELRLPDATLLQVQQWLLEVHSGGRPTGTSSSSSRGSSTGNDTETGTSGGSNEPDETP